MTIKDKGLMGADEWGQTNEEFCNLFLYLEFLLACRHSFANSVLRRESNESDITKNRFSIAVLRDVLGFRRLRVLIPLLTMVSFVSADDPVREWIEWIDIWVTDADKTDLPRVLLVGDSITRGYFDAVEKHLAGKAYCARLTTSKCVSDPTFNVSAR